MTTTPPNHMVCQSCNTAVRRGDAVIRANGHDQLAWHVGCWLAHKSHQEAVKSPTVGGSLTERLERAGLR